MTETGTCVYSDLEAKGLKSSGQPRVCEISLKAVCASDVKNICMHKGSEQAKSLCLPHGNYFFNCVHYDRAGKS